MRHIWAKEPAASVRQPPSPRAEEESPTLHRVFSQGSVKITPQRYERHLEAPHGQREAYRRGCGQHSHAPGHLGGGADSETGASRLPAQPSLRGGLRGGKEEALKD